MASEAPVAIAKRALTEATLQAYDVLLLDTAGRLHVDAEMMAEVRELEAAIQPHERLFVVDSMAGQDAVNAAKAFNDALSLTGVILTKADGDARGGAALSVRQVTGQADPVRRHGREIRSVGAVPAGTHRLAHPRDGRCAVTGRAGAGPGRPGKSRKARQEDQQGQVLRS